MDPANTDEFCGEGLSAVLRAIGEANNLGGPLPPVLHMGSCVDNSRAVALAVAVAEYIGVDVDKLPVVASAAEAVWRKGCLHRRLCCCGRLADPCRGHAARSGQPAGYADLTDKVKDLTGGYFIVDLDPESAAEKLLAAIDERRAGLGLQVPQAPQSKGAR